VHGRVCHFSVYILTILCVALLCGGHVVFYALRPSIIRLRMQRVLYNAPIFFLLPRRSSLVYGAAFFLSLLLRM
jgi:hypothetical protein